MSDEKDSRLSQATVLFVDDEENILKSIHRGLLDEPYKKKYASSGSEASPANLLKKRSSCPKITEGRRITAPGKAPVTAPSPAALLAR